MIYLRVREHAEKQGLTIGDLSHISHVRPTLLMAIFRNPYKADITLKTLDALSEALSVPAEQLVRTVKEPQE